MILKFISAAVFLVAVIVPAFADNDYYAQKIGVSFDKKGEYAGICKILRETLLSLADSDSNIQLFSGDKSDLETLSVNSINASVIIIIDTNGLNYRVGLYKTGEKTGEKLELLDNSIEFGRRDVIASIQPAARKMLDILKADYPMMKKEELKTVELVKVRVSEFESTNPSISVRLTPGFTELNSQLSYQQQGNSSNGGGGGLNVGTNLAGGGPSVRAEGILSWYAWNAWLGGGILTTGGFGYTSCLNAGAGYGIFGSLIILGLEFDYFNTHFTSGGLMAGTDLNFPSGDIQNFTLCPVLQFNITKSYYIRFASGLPTPGNGTLNFNQQGISNYNSNFSDSAGPPYIDILFNFEVVPRFRISLDYMRYAVGTSDNYQLTNGMNFSSFRYTIVQLGLGFEYEF